LLANPIWDNPVLILLSEEDMKWLETIDAEDAPDGRPVMDDCKGRWLEDVKLEVAGEACEFYDFWPFEYCGRTALVILREQ